MHDESPLGERSLHDVYAEYDELWRRLATLAPDARGGVRDADDQESSEASRLRRRMRNLMAAIRKRERDFETDLASVLGAAMKADTDLSAEVYAALCNVEWEHEDGSRYACSWRAAAGLVAEIRTDIDGDEDYLTWYCTGNEGHVSEKVGQVLAALGWRRRLERQDAPGR